MLNREQIKRNCKNMGNTAISEENKASYLSLTKEYNSQYLGRVFN